MTTSYRPTGLIRYHAAGTYRGYTLFSPNGGDDAYLIDMEGNFVHRWRYPGGIAYGYLLDNGNNLILLQRDSISAELTRRVRGGFNTASDPEQMLGDQVAEVTPDGVEVNVWRSAEHLDRETDVIAPWKGATPGEAQTTLRHRPTVAPS